MSIYQNSVEFILGFILVASSLGVILAKKPVHSSLAFLLTLMTLAAIYLQLSAEFIAVLQVLVYAGAILVLFMFVMMLFQDAIRELANVKPKSYPFLLFLGGSLLVVTFFILGGFIYGITSSTAALPPGFGTAEQLGKALYLDFFFPFEAVILIFIVAVVGALYTAKKG